MDVQKKTVDFLDISPYVRYAHRCTNADQTTHQIPWRYIYDYELLYISAGEMEIITKDTTYRLQENDIHIIEPMLWHTIEIPQGEKCSYYSVHFDFINLGRENDFSPEEVYISNCNHNLDAAPVDEKLVRRPLCVLGSVELPKKMHIQDPVAYTKILEDIIKAQNEKRFAYQIDLKCNMLLLLKQILCDVKLRMADEAPGMDNLSEITEYILRHYNTPIRFDAVARSFGYSYSHFRKLFKSKAGITPHEFLTNIRIERAVALLYCKQYTVSQIAEMVGYTDSTYFSRVFRQKKGCAPSLYIK